MQESGERLQKLLAQRGYASRRGCATMIRDGRVSVNGNIVTEPGLRVDALDDRICVDGQDMTQELPPRRTLILYKPRGYVCSRTSQGSKIVYDLIKDVPESVVSIGRLDKDSEGLLLMSNDGDLVDRLTHPRYEHRKTYEVMVEGDVCDDTIALLRSPMRIGEKPIRPAEVRQLRAGTTPGTHLLEFVLQEGRNRQIRRMCEQAGLSVRRLTRVAIRDLRFDDVAPGTWRDLTDDELSHVSSTRQLHG